MRSYEHHYIIPRYKINEYGNRASRVLSTWFFYFFFITIMVREDDLVVIHVMMSLKHMRHFRFAFQRACTYQRRIAQPTPGMGDLLYLFVN